MLQLKSFYIQDLIDMFLKKYDLEYKRYKTPTVTERNKMK